jgi:hypothetical protein
MIDSMRSGNAAHAWQLHLVLLCMLGRVLWFLVACCLCSLVVKFLQMLRVVSELNGPAGTAVLVLDQANCGMPSLYIAAQGDDTQHSTACGCLHAWA